MLPEATQHAQALVNVELTPNWVQEWDVSSHMQRYLVGIDAHRVTKMQVLRYVAARRQYRVRFHDADTQEEEAWVDADAFTHMLQSHLHGNAVEQAARLYQTRTLELSTSRTELVESLAIICVLLVFVAVYLTRR